MIDSARVALRDRRPADALVDLFSHERRFPHGELTDERELLLVRALLARGLTDRAHDRATAYLERSPSGTYSAEMRALVAR